MSLAGNMKLRNFVLLAIVAAGAGSVGLYMACSGKKHTEAEKEEKAERHREKEERAKAAATPDAAVAAAPTPPLAPPPASVDLVARAYDTEAIAWKGKTISGDKIKDASHGKPYKINVYKDAGSPTVDRVKIDLNRNGKFDEKINFEKDGTITLERAPADDEKYTEKYHWTGTGWMKVAVPAEKSDKK
jgi:hypothetical protein